MLGAMPYLSAGIDRGDLPASTTQDLARALEDAHASELQGSQEVADPISDE